jgi:hypothetical protein
MDKWRLLRALTLPLWVLIVVLALCEALPR